MSFLEINDVVKQFATFTAVESFNLKIERGEFVSFLGPSGCGKTTTLRMVAGFEQPTNGVILLGDKDITYVPANKRNVGMVFQSYALFPNMSVWNNIAFGLKIARKPGSLITERVNEMLDIIQMREFGNRYPHQLSGGQQQRVALARALAIQPDVLLLDEPLSALDAKIRVQLREEIRAIQRRLGITTIYVTHDQEEALSVSDRIVVMSKGRIEQVGSPKQIYNVPQTRFVASFVGTLNVLEAKAVDAYHIALDGQTLTVEAGIPPEQMNTTLTCALRPEAIRIDAQVTPGMNRLTGKVEDVGFLGSVVRVRVRTGAQTVRLDTFNTPDLNLPSVGEEATLQFPPGALLVLQPDRTALPA